jgi:hypothetical protein
MSENHYEPEDQQISAKEWRRRRRRADYLKAKEQRRQQRVEQKNADQMQAAEERAARDQQLWAALQKASDLPPPDVTSEIGSGATSEKSP